MIIGVGGKSREEALAGLSDMTGDVQPVPKSEFESRLAKLQSAIRESGAKAAYLHAGTNLYYFTGLQWNPSERMVAAIVPSEGELQYVSPRFEINTLQDYWTLEAPIHAWEEHESPYEMVREVLGELQGGNAASSDVLVDEVTPFFIFDGLRQAMPNMSWLSAQATLVQFRSRKSPVELAIIKRAHEMTLEVQKATASILHEGISTAEVTQFIDQAHRKVGAVAGSYFCIVLFGVASSFPHGVKDPQILKANDWVLVDTGCLLHGYNSDITRSYAFGEPTEEHRVAWLHEKEAQLAGYVAAALGKPCEVCDIAARQSLESNGYGPGYQLPGLPTRSGHGCGLDIHEAPNLVLGETTPLDTGMVFSCEPMIVVPDRFGVRLEDHFYMGADGPVWFTQPSKSFEDPFGE